MDADIQPVRTTGRMVCLDALRGFDMFWIIGGQWIFGSLDEIFHHPLTAFVEEQLKHVEWIGFNCEDLIMPLFLFIVGAAMPFSFRRRLQEGKSRRKLYLHIIKRVAILFLLAMIVKGRLLAFEWSKIYFFCDTLQAIGIGYLITSIIILNLNIRWQIVATALLLLGYWAMVALVPVPGHGAGIYMPQVNLVDYVDHIVLGRFQFGTASRVISSMTFGAIVMSGALAGQLLLSGTSHRSKALRLLAIGIVCLAVGLLWSNWLPIIKKIWTSSFALAAIGWSYLLLTVFYLIIDVWGYRKWAFVFIVIGVNAIAVYVATMLFDFRQIGDIFVGGLAGHAGQWKALVQGTGGFAVVWLILYWMYRTKSFIKI